jgi:hypothetical protein
VQPRGPAGGGGARRLADAGVGQFSLSGPERRADSIGHACTHGEPDAVAVAYSSPDGDAATDGRTDRHAPTDPVTDADAPTDPDTDAHADSHAG